MWRASRRTIHNPSGWAQYSGMSSFPGKYLRAIHDDTVCGFIAAGGGKVINVASIATLFGFPFSIAYGASKGGMVQMTRSLCIAWAKDNIQTNAILPGWIDTDLSRSARKLMPGLSDSVLDRTPAGRWGAPSDFAGIAVFLVSRASDFVNGAAFPVDGGYSAKG
jgi:2-deoxy-D-gluconate 3-dehydrogenase